MSAEFTEKPFFIAKAAARLEVAAHNFVEKDFRDVAHKGSIAHQPANHMRRDQERAHHPTRDTVLVYFPPRTLDIYVDQIAC